MLGVKNYDSTIQSDGKILVISLPDNTMIRITDITDLKHENTSQRCSVIKTEDGKIIDIVVEPTFKNIKAQRAEKREKENKKLISFVESC